KGGLAMLWNESLEAIVATYSSNNIDMYIGRMDTKELWRFIRVYGHPETHKRMETWNLIRLLHERFHKPWICMGNFNEVLRASEKRGGCQSRLSRFEAIWTHHPGCREVIKQAWSMGTLTDGSMNNLFENIRACRRTLGRWNNETFGHVGRDVKVARLKLERLHDGSVSGDMVEEVKQASGVLNECLEREEMLWQQCSRVSWLREGDRNTTFFH
ncbi:LOW QUALITY PROTEIN: hypothetical protein CFOL_v3_32422, partial [Cephalotus follicularis]